MLLRKVDKRQDYALLVPLEVARDHFNRIGPLLKGDLGAEGSFYVHFHRLTIDAHNGVRGRGAGDENGAGAYYAVFLGLCYQQEKGLWSDGCSG